MKKNALMIMLVALIAVIPFVVSTMPTEALTWIISAKDGSWTVKALGAAGGGQAAEAMSWTIDPQGKLTSTGMGELNKLCSDCVTASNFLANPTSGVTNAAMQQAISSNPELGKLKEVATMREQLSQLGMEQGQVKLQKGSDGQLYVSEMSETKFNGKTKPNELLNALSMDNLQGVTATVEKNTLVKPLPEEEIIGGGSVKETVATKDKATVLGKMGQNSYVKMDENDKNIVKQAEIVTKEGESYKVNGHEFKGTDDCKINVQKTACEGEKCMTSVSIEAAPQKKTLSDRGETGVDQVSEVTMCGQTYKVASGTKLNFDVGDDGCTLQKGSEIKYSNKITGQTFKFKNVEFTTDNQKYDQQQGEVAFDGKKLEGTLKNVKLSDGTEINVGGDLTKRKTQVTDKISVDFDDKGNFKSASINAKERPVFLSHKGENLFPDGFKTKDTFFSVKPVTITAGKEDYTIRTPYHDYILSKPAKELPKVDVTEKINEELLSYDTALAITTSRPQPNPPKDLEDYWQRHNKEYEKDLTDYWQRHKTEFNKGKVEVYNKAPVGELSDYWQRHKTETMTFTSYKNTLVEYDPMLGRGELPYTYYNEVNRRFSAATRYDFVNEKNQVTEKGADLNNIGLLWKESPNVYAYRGVDESGNLKIYELNNKNGVLYYQGKPFEIKKGDYMSEKRLDNVKTSDYAERHKSEIKARNVKPPVTISDEDFQDALSKG